jgi:hypothetical protein
MACGEIVAEGTRARNLPIGSPQYPTGAKFLKKGANGSIFIPMDFMANGTMSSGLIRPGATEKRNELMLFIYLRCLTS